MTKGSHAQRRDPDHPFDDYEYWASQAVENNPGTNHPEYWWQTALHHYRKWVTTGDEEERRQAYLNLGRLIHLIEDQGVPAHAYYIKHGGAHFDNSTGSESPEYIKSLPLACEFHPSEPCTQEINDLGWMGGIVSSLEVRDAQVTLYSGKNRTGDTRVFDADTSYVGDGFNDRAWSLKIEPTQAAAPTADEVAIPVHIFPIDEYHARRLTCGCGVTGRRPSG